MVSYSLSGTRTRGICDSKSSRHVGAKCRRLDYTSRTHFGVGWKVCSNASNRQAGKIREIELLRPAPPCCKQWDVTVWGGGPSAIAIQGRPKEMVSYGSMRAHFPLMPKRIRFGARAANCQIIHLALKITRNRGERLEVGDKYI